MPKPGSVCHTPFQKTPQNRPFLDVKKMCLNYNPFAKMRQDCALLLGHQGRFYRGYFCPIVYPFDGIYTIKRGVIEVLFFRGRKSGAFLRILPDICVLRQWDLTLNKDTSHSLLFLQFRLPAGITHKPPYPPGYDNAGEQEKSISVRHNFFSD